MSAYVLANLEIIDTAGYEEYKQGVTATLDAYGGHYLVRGGDVETLLGEWKTTGRVVLIEFPSLEHLKQWYDSPEYRPLRAIRERCAVSTIIVMDGVKPPVVTG
jgi:uncharacterized protein (DUF1330 family)